MADYKEFRLQIAKSLNPSEKYQKKWLHKTLQKLGIDASLFIPYNIDQNLYNIIAGYLIGLPKIHQDNKYTKYNQLCDYCYQIADLTNILIYAFQYKDNKYYGCICDECILKRMSTPTSFNVYSQKSTLNLKNLHPYDISREVSTYLGKFSMKYDNFTNRDQMIKYGCMRTLLWLGIFDFTTFSYYDQ